MVCIDSTSDKSVKLIGVALAIATMFVDPDGTTILYEIKISWFTVFGHILCVLLFDLVIISWCVYETENIIQNRAKINVDSFSAFDKYHSTVFKVVLTLTIIKNTMAILVSALFATVSTVNVKIPVEELLTACTVVAFVVWVIDIGLFVIHFLVMVGIMLFKTRKSAIEDIKLVQKKV